MQASSSQLNHPPVSNPHVVTPYAANTYTAQIRTTQLKHKPAQYPWHRAQQTATLTEQTRILHAKLHHVLSHPDTARGWVLLLGVPKHITKTWFHRLGLDSRRVLIVYEHQLTTSVNVAAVNVEPDTLQPVNAALDPWQRLSTQAMAQTPVTAYEHWLRQSITNATCSVVIDSTSPSLRRASLGQALGAQFAVRYITLPLIDHTYTNHDVSQWTKYQSRLPAKLQITALKTSAYHPR